MRVPKRVTPYAVKGLTWDALFQGQHDTGLSQQTNAFALRCCGNSAHYSYHDIGCTPVTEVTAVDTWYSFEIGDTGTWEVCDYGVPWHHQDGQHAIMMRALVYSRYGLQFQMRFRAKTLVSAVATTTSVIQTSQHSTPFDTIGIRSSRWYYGEANRSLILFPIEIELPSPTLPANRQVQVEPQILLPSGSTTSMFDITGTSAIYLMYMQLYDIPKRETYG